MVLLKHTRYRSEPLRRSQPHGGNGVDFGGFSGGWKRCSVCIVTSGRIRVRRGYILERSFHGSRTVVGVDVETRSLGSYLSISTFL